MAKQRRSAPRGSYLPIILMGVTLLGLLGFSSMAVAWSLGYFDSETTAASVPVDRTGLLAFPAIVRSMNAYDRVAKEDFINPQTGQLNVTWLPEATAQVASREMGEIIGRVLSRDKSAGMVLTEADFMEKGTRPGLVAGIPAGKFAMSIPASDIPGLEQLRGGDRFDLLVALPKQENEDLLSNSEPAALFGGIKPASLRVGQLSRQHGVKHLVTNGMLVNLFSGSQRSTNGPAGLTATPSSPKTKPTPTPIVFAELAVDPEEIGPLTEAISMATKMTCVLRSGLPNGDVNDSMSIEGMVPVITTAMPVNAFAALTDENLMDESTGRLHFYYFPPDKISEEWITEPAKLYGRVVARPLRRGSLITESDLLPPGTRPGISAGLHPGMAGMSLSKSNVQGFENLSVGDRFSILTKVPGEVTASTPNTTWATLLGGQPDADDARIAEMVRTGIREVVRDAIYLAETDDDSVIIGVPELEVAKLAQLIRDKAEVFAVARSSQDEFESATRSRLFPGSAWEHTALEALPPDPKSAGGASVAASSQAGAWEQVDAFGEPRHPSPPAPLPEAGRGEPELNKLTRNGEPEFSLVALRDTETNQSLPTLVAQNQPNNAFENAPPHGDKIPVPILVQEVSAYDELTIDDFIDPTTGRVQTLYFDRANIEEDWELDIRKLIDRVTLRPLRAGRPVRASDLAPSGSSAGPAVGLEPGMRAVTVNSTHLVGLETLKVGAVFDLVSATGVEVSSLADTVRQSIASNDAVKEATKLPVGRVASSRVVATAVKLLSNTGVAQIMVPMSTGPTETQTQTRLTADGSTITETVKVPPVAFEERTVQQYVLAIQSESVGSVLGLLDDQNPLYVSVRPIENPLEAQQSSDEDNPMDRPVRAIIQEHVRGMDIESEVFLTDRVDPSNIVASGTSEGR